MIAWYCLPETSSIYFSNSFCISILKMGDLYSQIFKLIDRFFCVYQCAFETHLKIIIFLISDVYFLVWIFAYDYLYFLFAESPHLLIMILFYFEIAIISWLPSFFFFFTFILRSFVMTPFLCCLWFMLSCGFFFLSKFSNSWLYYGN